MARTVASTSRITTQRVTCWPPLRMASMPSPTTAGMATLASRATRAMPRAGMNLRFSAHTNGHMRRIQPSDWSGSGRPLGGS